VEFKREIDVEDQSLLTSISMNQRLRFGFGFAKAGDAIAFLPLAAFLEQFDAFEAFQSVALGA
jgi:hypothetical protein